MSRTPNATVVLGGHVRAADGRTPRPDLIVRAYRGADDEAAERLSEVTTDAQGRFRLRIDDAGAPGGTRRRRADGRSGGISLEILDAAGRVLHRTPPRSGSALGRDWVVELPDGRSAAGPAFEGVIGSAAHATALRGSRLGTLAHLRRMDPIRAARSRRLRAAGLDATTLAGIKRRAHLATVVHDDAVVDALARAGVDSVARLATTPPDRLRKEIEAAIRDKRLRVTMPSDIALREAGVRARQVYRVVTQAAMADLALAPPSCQRCDEGCCGEPGQLSILSQSAYLSYLVRVFGSDVDDLEAQFHQDFSAPACESMPLVRLGAEVLERALLAGDFPGVSLSAVLRLMLVDRVIVRHALLAQTGRLEEAARAEARSGWGGDFLAGVGIADDAELRAAVTAVEGGSRELAAFLGAQPRVAPELIVEATVRATGADLAGAASTLLPLDDFGAELGVFDGASPGAIVDVAQRLRRRLIELTGEDASRLRERYHVNFLATEGALSRCDLAVLTLQEAMRCGHAWYVACCAESAGGEAVGLATGTRFRTYSDYRVRVEQMLFPQNFYDLHLRAPLVRGDVAALREGLQRAEEALEARAAGSDLLKSLMELFRQGLQTVRELLDLDDLVTRAHVAFRDEEYGLAVELYRQAQQRIRRHVSRYHSATLAGYEELFYGRSPACAGDGPEPLRDAAALLGALERASLRPAFVSQLIATGRLQAMADKSTFWPSEGLIPTADDLANLWQDVQTAIAVSTTGGLVGMLVAAKVVRNESQLAQLRNAYAGSGLGVVDTSAGRRFSLPFILRSSIGPQLADRLGPALQKLLITLAFPKIEGRLGDLQAALTADVAALETCLRDIWGEGELDPITAGIKVLESLPCLADFASDIVETFDEELLNSLVGDCSHNETRGVAPFTFEVTVVDPVCVVSTIIERVTESLLGGATLLFDSAADLLGGLDDLPQAALVAVNAGIEEWLGSEFRTENLQDIERDNRAALGEFANEAFSAALDSVIVESQSAWIVRDGALQEVSNLYDDLDIRSGTTARRGTILFDREAAGSEAFGSYTAVFTLATGDNDDFGIVFRFREEDGGKSYYLLALRNNVGEAAQHATQKVVMEIAWTILMAYTLVVLGNSLPAALPLTLSVAFLTWLAGIAAAEFLWNDIFPPDTAGAFVRLVKVKAGQPPVVLAPTSGQTVPTIELNQDYRVRLDLADRPDGGLDIHIEIGKPEAPDPAKLAATDAEPIGPGGVGLYAFGNSKAVFKQADVTYYPTGHASLGQLLFAPAAGDRPEPALDRQPYECRLTSPPDLPGVLGDWVTVDADEFPLVSVRGPALAADTGAPTAPVHEPIDLTPYGIEQAPTLVYGPFDAHVDRYALASLTNRLVGLLPHYYFFVLPLGIADALHAAGDFEGAKRHYDVVYDLFPNEIEHRVSGNGGSGGSASAALVFGDPPARRIGYRYLHADIPHRQVGIEEGLLRARHAANHLAAGEAAFTRDDPESRRLAGEEFSRVLLAYGQTRCCEGWEGEVRCRPGGTTPPTESPTSAAGPPPDDVTIPPELKLCEKQIRILLGMLPRLPPAVRDGVKAALLGRRRGSRPTCEEVLGLLAEAERLLRFQGSRVIGTAVGRATLTPTEHAYPDLVTVVDLLGAKAVARATRSTVLGRFPGGGGKRPGGGLGKFPFPPLEGDKADDCEAPPEDCLALEERGILDDLRKVYTCPPPNPLTRSHLEQACLYLESLDLGLNVLGLRDDAVSAYRFETLLGLARHFATFAVNAEKDFLQFREKLASLRLTSMQQEHGLALMGAQQRVRQLAVDQAALQVRMSRYQVEGTELRDRHLDQLLALNDAAMAVAVLGGVAGMSQGLIGLASAGVGVAAAVPTGGASLALAGIGVAGAASGVAGSTVGAAQGILNVYQQRVMLEQTQELLRSVEQPLAQLGLRAAELQERMARRQVEIGLLELAFAERVLTYLSHQLLNAEMFSFLARHAKRTYRQYLDYATRAALMAERALELERSRPFQIVKLDYFDVSVQGLTGGESLVADLATLEFQRFVHEEDLQNPPPKIFSLASRFPIEFEHFRRTGQLWFRTDHDDFDRDFPGHHRRQIRSVRIHVLALVGMDGVKATLQQLGPTEIVVRDGAGFRARTLPALSRSVALAPAPDGRGLAPLNLEPGRLNPFEGTGVAASWLLELPRAANRFDYATIADVQLTVEYTAHHDVELGRVTREALAARVWPGGRAFRLRFDFPDVLYHLLNPSAAGPELTDSLRLNLCSVALATTERHYPADERDRVPDGVLVAFYDRRGAPVPVAEVLVASRRRVETLWRSGTLVLAAAALDPVADAGLTRVVRDGQLVTVAETAVTPGEVASVAAWHRVLRVDRMIWVPVGQERPGDVLPANLSPSTRPLPAVVPAELLRAAQVPMTRRDHTDAGTGVTTPVFDLPATPAPWPEGLAPADIWYLTLEPLGNPGLVAARQVAGHDVLDLSAVAEVLFVVNYRYRLAT